MTRIVNKALLALAGAAGFALTGLSGAAMAADAPQAAMVEEKKTDIVISGGAAFTTDYVFRGISQTNEDPAAQAYIEASYGMFYLGMWGSNLDFGGDGAGNTIADVEIDFYAGIRPKWGIAEFDLGVLYYVYPDAIDPGGEFNYFEGKATVSVPVHEMISLGAGTYFSPDFFGETGAALYVEANGSLTLPYGFGASAAIGYQWIDDNATAGIPDYLTWNVGVSYTFRDTLTFDLRYHDTDITGCALCDSRIVGTVKADFSTE